MTEDTRHNAGISPAYKSMFVDYERRIALGYINRFTPRYHIPIKEQALSSTSRLAINTAFMA